MSWWYHPRDGYCRPLPGGPYVPRIFEDPSCPSGSGVTIAWSNLTGVPTEFPPSPHGHVWDDLAEVPDCFPPCDHSHPASEITGVLLAPLREPDLSILTDPSGRSLWPPSSLQDTLDSKVPRWRRVDTTGSLVGGGDLSADRTLQLANDELSPGPDKQYATDVSGTKGWFAKASVRYTHSQGSPSAVWTVNHNLGFRPRVAVEDLAGQSVLADIQNVGNGFATLEIRFGSPMPGIAYLG